MKNINTFFNTDETNTVCLECGTLRTDGSYRPKDEYPRIICSTCASKLVREYGDYSEEFPGMTCFTTGAQKEFKDKVRVDLVTPEMILGLAEVLTYGAKKYDDHNWRKGLKNSVHYAAAMRHLLKFWSGIDKDDESGIHHLKHAMCNIGMMVTNIEREELDDRYIGETKNV